MKPGDTILVPFVINCISKNIDIEGEESRYYLTHKVPGDKLILNYPVISEKTLLKLVKGES